MTDQVKVMGMVISSSPIGENDKRIVLLTREKGKISAFVRGARRPGNHLMAASDSFAFGTFYLISGRDSYILAAAEISNYFREMAEDIEKTYTAYYFLELAEYYAVENADASQMLNLIYASFKALINNKISPALIKCIYELKILVLNGEYPDFFSCRKCETKENLVGFSIINNSVICNKCASGIKDIIIINNSTLYALQFVVCTGIAGLFTFTVSEQVLSEFKMVMARCMRTYVTKKMNSLEILDAISK